MVKPQPLILKLQADVVGKEIPVSQLLRLAKLIAVKLDVSDAVGWIDRELNGYSGATWGEMPSYRMIHGDWRAWNPLQGWLPIIWTSPPARNLAEVPVVQPVAALEELISSDSEGELMFQPPHELEAALREAISTQTQVRMMVSRSEVGNIIDQVRNLILNWSLELEKAGVMGEGMTFTSEERREAQPVTQNIFVQNAGTVGNVSHGANVENHQTATLSLTLDLELAADVARQAREALPMLPAEAQAKVTAVLDQLEPELTKAKPDRSRVRGLLESLREVAVGTAGNLAAAGLQAIVAGALGS